MYQLEVLVSVRDFSLKIDRDKDAENVRWVLKSDINYLYCLSC